MITFEGAAIVFRTYDIVKPKLNMQNLNKYYSIQLVSTR